MSKIGRVTVIGAGTMGAGIAQVAAQAGCDVVLHDVDESALERGVDSIRRMLDKGVEKQKTTPEARDAALARIRTDVSLSAAVAGSHLVIEAVPESPSLKQEVLRSVAEATSSETLLASNTSSLSIGSLAEHTGRPQAFLGMHFFNPVPIMKLLELVVGEKTAPETVAAARALGEAMGKTVIEVRDAPGFATSRLGIALGMEAIRMVEQGVASAPDIDTAMTLGYGHPMGPLRLTDLVGLDVRLAIAEYLHQTLEADAFRPPELLRRMVGEGKLGKKSGRGFYDWSE